MDLKNMSPKDRMIYEVATESMSNFIEKLRNGIIEEDFEETLYLMRRAEYKRGKWDGSLFKPKKKLESIEQIRTKKIPVVIKFKRKDGTIAKIKATKCVVDSDYKPKTN